MSLNMHHMITICVSFYVFNSFTAGLFLCYFSVLVNALIVLNDIIIQYRIILSSVIHFEKYIIFKVDKQTSVVVLNTETV